MGVFHKYLNDRQYAFCEYYCFGVPIPTSILEAFKDYMETPEPKDKELKYRKASNWMKYLYHNATGSYYHAFKGSTYASAKVNANRLLKDPNVIQEIAFMEEFIKNICHGNRCQFNEKYISPYTNLYDIRGKDRTLFLKSWHLIK